MTYIRHKSVIPPYWLPTQRVLLTWLALRGVFEAAVVAPWLDLVDATGIRHTVGDMQLSGLYDVDRPLPHLVDSLHDGRVRAALQQDG